MVRLREEDLDAINPEQFKVFKKGQGIRETLSRAIQIFPGDVPVLSPLFKFMTPVTTRLLRSESELIRKYAGIFLENPVA